MNYTDIIQRAARLTWRYKVLWILGILLALSGGSGGSTTLTYHRLQWQQRTACCPDHGSPAGTSPTQA
ncbi:MAG: hypothetical protein V9H69_16610 [Anaerolineae bacterium]